jgi:hypothetical protein
MQKDTLPAWARGGFNPPKQSEPYVIGAKHHIVGVLFARPLYSPPVRSGQQNKILWIPKVIRQRGAMMKITARLAGSDAVVTRRVNAGPSIVNLPSAGCWKLTLSWSGQRDTVDVRYRTPPAQ